MALLFIDGFDHYQKAHTDAKWEDVNLSGSNDIDPTGGRDGGGALKLNGQSLSWVAKTAPLRATLVCGARVRYTDLTFLASPRIFMEFRRRDQTQCELLQNLDHTVSVRRRDSGGAATTLGTTTATLAGEDFTYVEFKLTVHPTEGAFEVRFNGQTVLAESNINTRSSLTSENLLDTLRLRAVPTGANSSTHFFWFDDFYLLDTLGDRHADFLGPVQVATRFPSADGAYSELTPSSGTDHYARVNGAAPDGDDNYLSSETVGEKSSFTLPPLPAEASTVLAVQTLAYARKIDAGARASRPLLRLGGTDHAGAEAPLSIDYRYLRHLWPVHPGTDDPWTPAALEGAEGGFEIR